MRPRALPIVYFFVSKELCVYINTEICSVANNHKTSTERVFIYSWRLQWEKDRHT